MKYIAKNRPIEVLCLMSFFILFLNFDTVFDYLIKKNNIYDIEFVNKSRRGQLKLLKSDWVIDAKVTSNFEVGWKNVSKKGMLRKIVIEYGYLNPITETDVYYNPKRSHRVFYSVYDFQTKFIKYYYDENVNGKNFTISIPENVFNRMLQL